MECPFFVEASSVRFGAHRLATSMQQELPATVLSVCKHRRMASIQDKCRLQDHASHSRRDLTNGTSHRRDDDDVRRHIDACVVLQHTKRRDQPLNPGSGVKK